MGLRAFAANVGGAAGMFTTGLAVERQGISSGFLAVGAQMLVALLLLCTVPSQPPARTDRPAAGGSPAEKVTEAGAPSPEPRGHQPVGCGDGGGGGGQPSSSQSRRQEHTVGADLRAACWLALTDRRLASILGVTVLANLFCAWTAACHLPLPPPPSSASTPRTAHTLVVQHRPEARVHGAFWSVAAATAAAADRLAHPPPSGGRRRRCRLPDHSHQPILPLLAAELGAGTRQAALLMSTKQCGSLLSLVAFLALRPRRLGLLYGLGCLVGSLMVGLAALGNSFAPVFAAFVAGAFGSGVSALRTGRLHVYSRASCCGESAGREMIYTPCHTRSTRADHTPRVQRCLQH